MSELSLSWTARLPDSVASLRMNGLLCWVCGGLVSVESVRWIVSLLSSGSLSVESNVASEVDDDDVDGVGVLVGGGSLLSLPLSVSELGPGMCV